MEPDQERIARIMQATGTTEDEARILAHLGAASDGFFALPGHQTLGVTMVLSHHFDALNRIIASRVAERHHPEGWSFAREPDEEDEDVPPLA